ncbi:MAG: hypothetical protein ACD_37C00118G0008 [uncultured bacterium]|nr:MAG: hypothetical protein ACD_37C00118G0008 [uncultured bacterium]
MCQVADQGSSESIETTQEGSEPAVEAPAEEAKPEPEAEEVTEDARQ